MKKGRILRKRENPQKKDFCCLIVSNYDSEPATRSIMNSKRGKILEDDTRKVFDSFFVGASLCRVCELS